MCIRSHLHMDTPYFLNPLHSIQFNLNSHDLTITSFASVRLEAASCLWYDRCINDKLPQSPTNLDGVHGTQRRPGPSSKTKRRNVGGNLSSVLYWGILFLISTLHTVFPRRQTVCVPHITSPSIHCNLAKNGRAT